MKVRAVIGCLCSALFVPVKSLNHAPVEQQMECSSVEWSRLWSNGQRCLAADECSPASVRAIQRNASRLSESCEGRLAVKFLRCDEKHNAECAPEAKLWTGGDPSLGTGAFAGPSQEWIFVASSPALAAAIFLTGVPFGTELGLVVGQMRREYAAGIRYAVGVVQSDTMIPATWEAFVFDVLPKSFPAASRAVSEFARRGCDLVLASCPLGRRPCALHPGEHFTPYDTFYERMPWMAFGTSLWPTDMRVAAAAAPLHFTMSDDEESSVDKNNPAMNVYRKRRRAWEFSLTLANDLVALADSPQLPGTCAVASFVFRSMIGNQYYSGVAEPCMPHHDKPRCSFTYAKDGARGFSEYWMQNGLLNCPGEDTATATIPEYCATRACPNYCASIFKFREPASVAVAATDVTMVSKGGAFAGEWAGAATMALVATGAVVATFIARKRWRDVRAQPRSGAQPLLM